MRLELIVARARNGVIGRQGTLPWRLPEDLAYFRRTTMGQAIIMGRKTWDSLGRALPGRLSIVVTRDPAWQAAGALAVRSLAEAVAAARAALTAGHPLFLRPDGSAADIPASPIAFIIGGAQIYREALASLPIDTLHITEVDARIDGDAWFPDLDPAGWRECARDSFPAGDQRELPFAIVRYEAVTSPRA